MKRLILVLFFLMAATGFNQTIRNASAQAKKPAAAPVKAAPKTGARTVAKTAPKNGPKIGLIKPVDFNKFKQAAQGKVLVVNFWATWCGPCVAEFPELVALDAKYRNQGLKLVGISADELTDINPKVIPFIKEQKASFEILVQDTDDPQEMVDVVNKEWSGVLPATFVYDKQGNPIFTKFGILDRAELVAAIEKALK